LFRNVFSEKHPGGKDQTEPLKLIHRAKPQKAYTQKTPQGAAGIEGFSRSRVGQEGFIPRVKEGRTVWGG